MKRLIQLVWPYLEREPAETAIQLEEELKTDIEAINAASWNKTTLEEARNLNMLESERKRAAETKASIYLAVIAAIIPILSSLVTDFYGRDVGAPRGAFQAVTLTLFILGLLYLLASGAWSFRTLKVSVHHRVDIAELLKASEEKEPDTVITRELLLATRLNRDGVNQKTSCIKMAHEFLIRTFFTFAALLAVIVLWQPVSSIAEIAYQRIP